MVVVNTGMVTVEEVVLLVVEAIKMVRATMEVMVTAEVMTMLRVLVM